MQTRLKYLLAFVTIIVATALGMIVLGMIAAKAQEQPAPAPYRLPTTRPLTPDELKHAAACVDVVEALLAVNWNRVRSLRSKVVAPSTPPVVVPPAPPVTPPVVPPVVTPPPVKPPVDESPQPASPKLVRGPGPQPDPEPVSVAGRRFLAPSATLRAASIAYGSSTYVLNFFDNDTDGPWAQEVEFSLDGGPWIATRSGRVVVEGTTDGAYQVRIVSFPPTGMSRSWGPVVLVKKGATWTVKE